MIPFHDLLLVLAIAIVASAPFWPIILGMGLEKLPWLLDCIGVGWLMLVAAAVLPPEWYAPAAGAGLVVVYAYHAIEERKLKRWQERSAQQPKLTWAEWADLEETKAWNERAERD